MREYTVTVTFYVKADDADAAWDEVARAVIGTALVAKIDPKAVPAPPLADEGTT